MVTEREFSEAVNLSRYEVAEVILGFKQTALIINFELGNRILQTLFRPESGLRVSIDSEIPKPEELYRDCAFSEICNELDLEFVPLVVPWCLDSEKGVLRQYWKSVRVLQPYQLDKQYLLSIDGGNIWKKMAVVDYVLGVADRVANDILITDSGVRVVDSGYSFVPGVDLGREMSCIRKVMFGEDIRGILKAFEEKQIREKIRTSGYINDESKYWADQRFKRITEDGVVL